MTCTSCRKREARPGKTRCEHCATVARAASKRWYAKLTPKQMKRKRAIDRAHYRKYRDRFNELNKIRSWNLKLQVLEHYGKKCECCRESEPKFLQLDHSNGDGAAHRRKLKVATCGVEFYKKLRRQGFPKNLGLRVLCANCHGAISKYGKCPHKERKHI